MNLFSRWLPVTRLKIRGASILYKITTLFTGRNTLEILRGGVRYEVDLAEGMELSLFLFGRFQKHITQNAFLRLDAHSVVFDVGANVGVMTLQFARMVSEGRVISFEPTHYALDRLERNISLNPELAGRITVVHAFVSERSDANPGLVAYSSWKVNGERSGHEHPVHLGTPKGASGVPSVSLNDFVENGRVDRLDLIKIDTDGHEYEVLKGADRAIARLRPRIIFEIGRYLMEERKIGFDVYVDYFSKLNYELVDARTGAQVTLANYKRSIPAMGSTDLIAIPNAV